MKILARSVLALALVFNSAAFVNPAAANVPALFINTHKTKLPFNDCLRDAKRTVEQLGLQNRESNSNGASGMLGTTRVSILCTFLPKAGPCPGQDGAVVTMISTGLTEPETRQMIERMVSTFGNAGIIDCG